MTAATSIRNFAKSWREFPSSKETLSNNYVILAPHCSLDCQCSWPDSGTFVFLRFTLWLRPKGITIVSIQVGNEVVTIWDHYAAGATALSCLIVHMIGWLWAYGKNNHSKILFNCCISIIFSTGRKNLKRDLECMIVRPISGLWIFSWSFVTIILLTVRNFQETLKKTVSLYN